MKQKLTVLLLAVLSATLMMAAAAMPNLKFRRLDIRDGLSNSRVNCMLKDSRGYFWVGTPYGLNRYDGYRFKTFYAEADDSTSLPHAYVNDIMEDGERRMWVRCGSDYCFYNPVTEHFDRHVDRLLARYGIEGGLDKLFIDSRKNLWASTFTHEVYCYQSATRRLLHFKVGELRKTLADGEKFSSFMEYGHTIVGVTDRGQLICFDRRSGRVAWRNDYVKRRLKTDGLPCGLYIDARQNFYVIAAGNVYAYSRRLRRWFHSLAAMLRAEGFGHVPDKMIVWDITVDRDHRLWIASDHQGLLVADFGSRQLDVYMPDRMDESSISDATLTRFYTAPDGRMWVGTYKNGLNMVAGRNSGIITLPLGDANTITEDRQGNYWIGTNDNGIVCYHPQTGEKQVFNKQTARLASNVIVSSLAASDGSLWFGSYEGGLMHYHDGAFRPYLASDQRGALASNNIWALAEDRRQNIWVGTLGAGIQRLDKASGQFATISEGRSRLASNYISSLSVMADGRILAGTSSFCSLVDPTTGRVTNCQLPMDSLRHVLSTPSTHQALADSRGLIWLCSTAGVSVYDPRTGRLSLIDRSTGLGSSTACGVAEDRNHTVWVVTEYGLSAIVPHQDADRQWLFTVCSYNNRDGLQNGPYNQRSLCITRSGLLLVGGIDGVDVIDPRSLDHHQDDEQPLFSGLTLFGREIGVGDEYDGRVVLEQSLDGSRRLRLRYTENQFGVQLGSTNSYPHSRTRFAYRIDGFSSQWVMIDDPNPVVTFTGLPSGCYTLSVRMVDNNGLLGKSEARLAIVIAPPFWRSGWAYSFYVLLVIIGLYFYNRRQKKALHLAQIKMEREKDQKVKEEKGQFVENMSDDLRKPFEAAFTSLTTLMSTETDEQRYENENMIFTHVESLLGQINQRLTQEGSKRSKIVPKIKEVEITSLDEKLVKDATDYVENNLSNGDITVETMSEAMGMSRVHLYKRLLSLTGSTPSEFIRKIRLRHAEQLLRKSQLTVSEVSYKVGFNNPRYFSKYFKEMYGMMPSQYKAEKGL